MNIKRIILAAALGSMPILAVAPASASRAGSRHFEKDARTAQGSGPERQLSRHPIADRPETAP